RAVCTLVRYDGLNHEVAGNLTEHERADSGTGKGVVCIGKESTCSVQGKGVRAVCMEREYMKCAGKGTTCSVHTRSV
ncbi:MAG: hypothetical protein ACREOZ_00120, partial [Gloeomargaritales cyanobacterium]